MIYTKGFCDPVGLYKWHILFIVSIWKWSTKSSNNLRDVNWSTERKNEEPNYLNSSPSRIIKEDSYVAIMGEINDRQNLHGESAWESNHSEGRDDQY